MVNELVVGFSPTTRRWPQSCQASSSPGGGRSCLRPGRRLEGQTGVYEYIHWDQGLAPHRLVLRLKGLPMIGTEAAQNLRDLDRFRDRWAKAR